MPKTGRNEPCPCGSGKKYKRCCLPKDQAAEQLALAAKQPERAATAANRMASLQRLRDSLQTADELTAASRTDGTDSLPINGRLTPPWREWRVAPC